jgi:hypothetical protein
MSNSLPIEQQNEPPASTPLPPKVPPAFIPLVITLTTRRWRQHLGILLIIGLGVIVAVTLICSSALYTQVAETAGLRDAINSAPDQGEVAMSAHPTSISTGSVQQLQNEIAQQVQQTIGPYMAQGAQFTLQTGQFNLPGATRQATNTLSLSGVDTHEASSHLQLIQGSLPAPCTAKTCTSKNDIEIALLPATAQALHLQPGSTFRVNLPLSTTQANEHNAPTTQPLQLRVVGTFTIPANDPYWHSLNFTSSNEQGTQAVHYQALIDRDSFISALTNTAHQIGSSMAATSQVTSLNWYYRPHTTHLVASQIAPLKQQLVLLQTNLRSQFARAVQNGTPPPQTTPILLQSSMLSQSGQSGVLDTLSARLAITWLPTAILTFFLLCMPLLFVSIMAKRWGGLQRETIVLLRSRGASTRRIFAALALLAGVLSVIALIVGGLLTLSVTNNIVQNNFGSAEQGALNLISDDPRGTLLYLSYFALATVVVLFIILCCLLYRSSHEALLALPQQRTQTARRPFWKQLQPDRIVIIAAFVLFGSAVYLTNFADSNIMGNTLLVLPVTLIGLLFLVVACMLLFLRAFPHVLHFCRTFALRNSRAESSFANDQLTHIKGTAWQASLLLILATSIAVFSLVCSSSLANRLADMAAFQTGSDFSGRPAAVMEAKPINDVRYAYSHIAGVISATPGYTAQATSTNEQAPQSIALRAVDAEDYASTVIWSRQDATQPVDDLMHQLISQRQNVQASNVVPAIIDASAASRLHLSLGSRFSFNEQASDASTNAVTVRCTVSAIVNHIPTINDSRNSSSANASSSANTASVGVLVDYQSLATFDQNNAAPTPPVNIVWLHTYNDGATLANVRAALQSPTLALDQVNDRFDMITRMQTDPLYLELIGLLSMGKISALALAIIGTLVLAWQNIHRHVNNVAAQDASSGHSPQHAYRMMLWEQAAIYGIAISAGLCLSALLCVSSIPSILYTSAPLSGISTASNGGTFFIIQHALTAYVQVPASVGLMVVELIILYGVAITAMIRLLSIPRVQQLLQ